MSKQKKDDITTDETMVKDSSVTEQERKEKERLERIEKLEETTADLAARVAALESKVM